MRREEERAPDRERGLRAERKAECVGAIRALVIPDLAAMTRAARAAGAPIAVESAYRSYSTQISVFNSWVQALGYDQAIRGSARPGHSEHQLGVALDFKTPGGSAPWSIGGYDWATSWAGAWMMKNAWKFGFILSYPRGQSSQVCYGYEPWHYRYFGKALAAAIHASGETSRAWLWQQRTIEVAPPPSPRDTGAITVTTIQGLLGAP